MNTVRVLVETDRGDLVEVTLNDPLAGPRDLLPAAAAAVAAALDLHPGTRETNAPA